MFANATTYPPLTETEEGGGGGRCVDQVSGIIAGIGWGFHFHKSDRISTFSSFIDGEAGEVRRGVPRHEHQHNT